MFHLFPIVIFDWKVGYIVLNWFVKIQFAIFPDLGYCCHSYGLADTGDTHYRVRRTWQLIFKVRISDSWTTKKKVKRFYKRHKLDLSSLVKRRGWGPIHLSSLDLNPVSNPLIISRFTLIRKKTGWSASKSYPLKMPNFHIKSMGHEK